jgi:hypothetical protein
MLHKPTVQSILKKALWLLAALLLPLQAAGAAAPWGANHVVALTDSTIEDRPRMAAGPGGEMVAVFSLEYDIYATARNAGASVWANPVKITDPSRSLAILPDVAIGSTGIVYTVWTDKRTSFNNDIYFSRSTDAGVTWSANVDIIPTLNRDPNQVEPTIALDPRPGYGNVIYVAYFENPASGQMFVDFSKSTDGGGTWTFQRLAYPAPPVCPNVIYPTCPTIYKIGSLGLAVDAQGRIYLIFDEVGSEDTRIFFTTSNDGGQSWEEMIPLTPLDTCRVAHNPALALGNTGVVYVAYVQTNHTGCDNNATEKIQLKLLRSANEGQNWGNPVLAGLSNQPKDILQNLGLAVLAHGFGVTDDEIVIAWSDYPAKFQLYSIQSKNGGTNWGSPVKISDAAGAENINADFPELVTSNGVVNAIWRDARQNSSLRIPYTAAMAPSLSYGVFLPIVIR